MNYISQTTTVFLALKIFWAPHSSGDISAANQVIMRPL